MADLRVWLGRGRRTSRTKGAVADEERTFEEYERNECLYPTKKHKEMAWLPQKM